MKHLKRYNELEFYNRDLKKFLPDRITIIKAGKRITYSKGNLMKNASMIQITYSNEDIWAEPETLEFDLYLTDHNKFNKINVDITHGDEVVCSFYIIPPNTSQSTLSTSFNSKFDPSNTIFALDDESINGMVNFFNKIDGFKLTSENFTFLKG